MLAGMPLIHTLIGGFYLFTEPHGFAVSFRPEVAGRASRRHFCFRLQQRSIAAYCFAGYSKAHMCSTPLALSRCKVQVVLAGVK